MIKKLLVFAMICTALTSTNAQSIELGAFGGLSYYNGDLNPTLPFVPLKPAFGIVGRYSKGTRWAYSMAVTSGGVGADGRNARVNTAQVFSFDEQVTDISLVAEFNFFDYFTGSEKEYMTPYLFAGIAYFGSGEDFAQSLAFNRLSVPFGIGFKYSLTDRIGLSAEWRMHKAFADNLEGKVVTDAWETGQSDPNNNDWYNFTGISITYRFSLQKRQACNSFRDVAF